MRLINWLLESVVLASLNCMQFWKRVN